MARIIESAARTVSGSSDAIARGSGESLRAQLHITSASGTSPALTVVLEDSLDSGATWNTIGSFAQKTAAGREIINISVPFAENLRVSWTIAGTNPSFTFSVDLSAQRSN
jgi:hypothetical protein